MYVYIYFEGYIYMCMNGTLLGAYGACVRYIHNIYKYTDKYICFFIHAF
jgi:hypothetical protein